MKLRFFTMGMLGLVVGLSAAWQAGCSSSSSGTTPTDGGTSEGGGTGDITIGFADSITGGLAGLGIPLQQAAQVATQQINQVGVLGGRHIRIEVVDDLSNAPGSNGEVNVANHFISERVPAVLGPLSSGEALAVDKLYAMNKIITISPSATSPALTNEQPMTDRYFFRTAPADDFQGKAITKLIYDGVKLANASPSDAGAGDGGAPSNMVGGNCRKAYVVYGDDGYGLGLSTVVNTTFMARPGASVIGTDKVPTTLQPDYKTLTQKIVAANPDCLVLIVYSDVGAQFMRDLRTAMGTPAGTPLKFPVVGSDGEDDSAFIPGGQTDPTNMKSPNVVEGVIGTSPDPAPQTNEYKIFRNIWQSAFPGMEPPSYAANLYDAALVLALAIQQAGTATDGQKIRDALYQVTNPTGASVFTPDKFVQAEQAIASGGKIKYVGASGPMTFDQYGNVTGDYIVWSVDKQGDGTFGFDTVARISASDLQ